MHVDACDAAIKPPAAGFDDELDIVLFNHEPQWHLLDRFDARAAACVLRAALRHLYGKEGSWESLRAPVDLQLANSNWTADQIFAETGHRPTVQLGGVEPRGVPAATAGPKRYPLLCSGEQQRDWKGTDTILEAGELLGIRSRRYAGKNLEQPALGREYDAAAVFAVGSWFEGFCQPGLEALACGTRSSPPTTAVAASTPSTARPRWSCRRATPVRWPTRCAGCSTTSCSASELVANGLEVVERDFDWERRTDEFEEVLDGVVAGTIGRPAAARPAAPADPSCRWSCSRGTTCCTRSSSSSRCAGTPTCPTSWSSSTTARSGRPPTTRASRPIRSVLNERTSGSRAA